MANLFKRAQRRKAFLKIAITGPSGSGKTYSALLVALGLAGNDGKVAVIDTENASADLYADLGEYDTLTLSAPFTVAKYLTGINAAVDAGYDVLVIDSLTHEWEGQGGLLAQKETMDRKGGNSFTNFQTITKQHNEFIAAMLQSDIHIVATMRSKVQYALESDDKGKTSVAKKGMAPVQREGMDYEFTTVFDLDRYHQASITKDRTGLFDGISEMLSKKQGKVLVDWLNSASDEVPTPATAIAAVIDPDLDFPLDVKPEPRKTVHLKPKPYVRPDGTVPEFGDEDYGREPSDAPAATPESEPAPEQKSEPKPNPNPKSAPSELSTDEVPDNGDKTGPEWRAEARKASRQAFQDTAIALGQKAGTVAECRALITDVAPALADRIFSDFNANHWMYATRQLRQKYDADFDPFTQE
jgi:KaiC/GvpD/RAD55 family RecA-like ATPase